MSKIITAREAAKLIPDGATVGIAGMGLSGWAEEVACAIAENYKETGHPRNLNLKQGSAMGDWKERGVTRLGYEGLVTQWSGAHVGSAFALRELASANKLECHCLPQGIIVNLWREIAAGRPGLLSKVGLGTFVDPRLEGGKMNSCTKTDLVELRTFDGEEYLFYKGFPVDVALLRGTIGDENGNISFEKESVLNEGFAVAAAAKNSGGIVIVQVEYLSKSGVLKPKDIKIPGILVDYVVPAEDKMSCWQTEGVYFEPAFSGHVKKPLNKLEPLPLDERKVICRRCAMELNKGDIINLGVGLPSELGKVLAEEGVSEDVVMTTESGMIGGVPAALPNFGSAYNPEAIITHGDMFDFIDGGGLDVTCLGIGQADESGNINVSKLGTRLTGPGGFINITKKTRKVIFCGTLTGKAELSIENGGIKVHKEGSIKKFLKQVQQVTFAGKYAEPWQEILYITERCVMKLIDGQMTLIEIAPGIDAERDIFAAMDFVPKAADNLKTMDPAIFGETWGNLKSIIEGK